MEALARTGWDPASTGDPDAALGGRPRWCRTCAAADDEITNLLAGLAGRHVPAGPSGAPSRGAAHVLPTGRNFYSVDPKAIPSRLSWEVGRALADRLVERHLAETGTYPTTVGLVLWGTAAMRTNGDDVAEALALLGVRPTWDDQTQRVTGLEVIDLAAARAAAHRRHAAHQRLLPRRLPARRRPARRRRRAGRRARRAGRPEPRRGRRRRRRPAVGPAARAATGPASCR